jgi:uncharacterized repeat protein (TIGR02543 family)
MHINLRIFTTEVTELHGGRKKFRTKTPWYSVVNSFFFFTLLSTLFLTACPDTINPPPKTKPGIVQPLPAGYGSFTPVIAHNTARTILPAAPALSDFTRFELHFTPVDGQGVALTTERPYTDTGALEPVELFAGTYNLLVNAYKGSEIAARGTLKNIIISAAANVPGTIVLRALFDGEGAGTFTWNITLDASPITLNTATMTIKNSNGAVQEPVVTLENLGITSGSRSLPSGLYTVVFAINGVQDNVPQTLIWNELLHVYAELESKFSTAFTARHFTNTHWNVTFNENYTGGSSLTQSVMHGVAVKEPSPAPVRDGFIFGGWYKEADAENLWKFADYITDNITLYAKWTKDTTPPTIELTNLKSICISKADWDAIKLLPPENSQPTVWDLTMLEGTSPVIRGVFLDESSPIGHSPDPSGKYYFEYRLYSRVAMDLTSPSYPAYKMVYLGADTLTTENWYIPLYGPDSSSFWNDELLIPEGIWWLDIKVADRNGNTAESINLAFLIDRGSPNLTVATTNNLTYNAPFTLTGTVADANFWYLTINIDGSYNVPNDKINLNPIAGNSSYSWAWPINQADFSSLAEGYHKVTITAYDYAGKLIIREYTFIKDTRPPEIAFFYPERDGSSVITEANAQIRVAFIDDLSYIGNAQVGGNYYFEYRIYPDGSPALPAYVRGNLGSDPGKAVNYIIPLTGSDSHAEFWNNLPEIPDGKWWVDIRIADRIGNQTVYEGSYTGKYNETLHNTKGVAFSVDRGPPNLTFTSVDAFKAWLADQDTNTVTDPYVVKLNTSDLSGIDTALKNNSAKYVNLDLSGSDITGIGDRAFYNCPSLTGVTIPNGVKSIGNEAFAGTGLTGIIIPDGLKSIEASAFIWCTNLTSVTIPDSVTSIGQEAFKNCTSLTNIIIPDGVTSIGRWAFRECTSLASITIGNSVTTIENMAFYACTSLTNVTIGNSVTTIENNAFRECTSLANITIGNSVTTIEYSAFYACTSLTSVTIPDSVTSIGSSAFNYTPWFNSQQDGLVYAGKVAYKYKGDMPANTSITLLAGTKGIASEAFSGYLGPTEIIIPNSVTHIGSSAFSSSTNLTSVTFQGTIAENNFSTFETFLGDLRAKFYVTDPANGTPGTYTRPSGTSIWTKS